MLIIDTINVSKYIIILGGENNEKICMYSMRLCI